MNCLPRYLNDDGDAPVEPEAACSGPAAILPAVLGHGGITYTPPLYE